MRNILFFSLITLACCTLGCGSGGYTVSGKVSFPDGTPVPQGQVTFNSASFTGGGSIISDGTYNTNVRIPAGSYTVTVRALGDSPSDVELSTGNTQPVKPLVDPKYGKPETSGLVCEVKGPTLFHIEVTAPQ